MKLVIVGGGPAALSTARAYRQAGGDGSVVILTPELTVPYRRPPLSKGFLRGEVEDSALPIEPPDWYVQRKIEVRLGAEAETLDAAAHTITLGSGETLGYDACVLATGAEPAPLQVPGATEEWVLLLRSLATARVLRYRAETAKSAIVIGSGFIGCEVAASLAMRGLKVTVVSDERLPHATRLGPEAGARIQGWLKELNVELVLASPVEEIGERSVHVPGRDPLMAELILMATGVRPAAGLAETAGLAVRDGRVVVDASMRTSAEGVFAAGDVALAHNVKANRHLAVDHWGDALKMGEIAGRTLAGDPAEWNVTPAWFSTIGDHTLKHASWGDGFDETRLVDHGAGAFTVWYGNAGTTVGVLTHERDADYETGRERVETGAPMP
jgi:3-phenylpropionate/trans-cinnamate dioxygenase ferredoxin reductase subunit